MVLFCDNSKVINIFASMKEKKKKAGRKKLPQSEKKVPLIIYPQQKDIDLIGGIVIAKEKALSAISGS